MSHLTITDIVRILDADPGALETVARAAAGGSTSSLADWSVTQLAGGAGGNPTSDGIYRVAGCLADRAAGQDRKPTQWSAILKVVRSPVETGEPWDQPGDAIYWRREVEVFRSGLLDQVEGVVVPRCFAIADLPDSAAWLWLEDLGSLDRAAWGEPEFHVAARALARFHAPFLTGAVPLPDQPWLNRDNLRGFHAYLDPWWQRLSARVRAGGGPVVELRSTRASAAVAAVLGVVADPEPLLRAIDRLPVTLSHNDTHIDNLMVRPGSDRTPELVAIDWQMVGPGSIGADLGQLLSECPKSLGAASRAQFEDEVLWAYHDQVTRAGVDIDLAGVHLAHNLEAVLRQSLWEVLLLCLRLEELAPEDHDGQAEVIAEFARNAADGHLPQLAAQVRRAIRG